ncbi:MAG: sugar transferase [Pyrinomonadaceae bacterium]|jgi:lipopolysaccharide/colanic/teichoic acid biosynthesis glycosyltransferase|nr:sugar transferase [Pyrinomonadaceae bacterium]
MKKRKYSRGLPRVAEIFLAFAGLLFFLPIFLAISVLIKLSSHGSVLFCQTRIGQYGNSFTLYKFRTMRSDAEGLKLTSSDDIRITPTGKFLRQYKLDELPQLWNVLCGEMSFVGSRPEVPDYVHLENPLWQEVLEIRPGITDPITLKLRNEEQLLTTVDDKETFYTEILLPYKLRGWANYAKHKTWKTDLLVIFQTFKSILLPTTVQPVTCEELSVAIIDEQL